MQFAKTLLPAFQVHRGVALDGARIRKQEHLGDAAGFLQHPCDHEAVAAVVSLPAEHQNLSRRERGQFPAKKFRNRRARIFHQLQAGNGVPLGGEPVRFAHLCCGENFHALGSLEKAENRETITVISSACSGEPDHSSAARIMASAIT